MKRSAVVYAKNALAAAGGEDYGLAAIQMGVAIELGVKLWLVKRNPLLIASAKSTKPEHLADIHRLSEEPMSMVKIQTVAASDAFIRMKRIDGEAVRYSTAVDEILALRNHEAHLGLADHRQVEAVLPLFIQLVEHALETEGDSVWGPHAEHAAALVRGYHSEVAMRVVHLTEAARVRAAVILTGLSEGSIAAIVESRLQDAVRRATDEYFAVRCPACELTGLLFGENEFVEVEGEVLEDGSANAWAVFDFVARFFFCPVCSLRLDGHDEIEEAGLEPRFRNDDVDEAEYFADEIEAATEEWGLYRSERRSYGLPG